MRRPPHRWKPSRPFPWETLSGRTPPVNLSQGYSALGFFDKAAETAREGLRLDPNEYYAYYGLGAAYIGLNRLEEARAILEQAIAKHLDNFDVHAELFYLAFQNDD